MLKLSDLGRSASHLRAIIWRNSRYPYHISEISIGVPSTRIFPQHCGSAAIKSAMTLTSLAIERRSTEAGHAGSMAPLHNRRPVIIAPTNYGRWLVRRGWDNVPAGEGGRFA